jgi:hypothetical protein
MANEAVGVAFNPPLLQADAETPFFQKQVSKAPQKTARRKI